MENLAQRIRIYQKVIKQLPEGSELKDYFIDRMNEAIDLKTK